MKKKYRWSSIILLLIISLILIIGISNGISLDIDSLREYIDSSKYSEIIFIAIWCIRLISFIPGVTDRKSTRQNSSHTRRSRMPSSS